MAQRKAIRRCGLPDASVKRSRDPDDDYLIALAIKIRADCLISGDKDLLDLDTAEIRIVSVAEMPRRHSETSGYR